MTRLFFTFKEEPQGQSYFDLIDYAVTTQRCKFAFLVEHRKSALSESGRRALESLKSFLIESVEVSEWPGTKLVGKYSALLHKYDFGLDLANHLKSLSRRLYEWEHPDLPEDLSLMIDDKLPWLFTIAHEKDAVLCLQPNELEDMQKLSSVSLLLIKDNIYRENLD